MYRDRRDCLTSRWVPTIFCALLSVFVAEASPRAPYPPLPETGLILYHERFDDQYSYWTTNSQVTVGDYLLVQGWSGFALDRSGASVVPFIVPGVDGGAHTNLSPQNGALRFWFTAGWTSSTLSGTGPGATARLADLLAVGTNGESLLCWSLRVSSDGSTISLLAQSDSGTTTLLTTNIGWQAGTAHNLALNYGTNGTQLFLDGALAAEGSATVNLPAGNAALVLGSSLAGSDPAHGSFDEVYSFGRFETAFEVDWYYTRTEYQAVLGPRSAEEDAAIQARRAAALASRESSFSSSFSSEGTESFGGRDLLGCLPGGPVYLTNTAAWFDTNNGWQVSFDARGGSADSIYEVLGSTNVAADLSTWSWLTNTYTCSTVFLLQQPETNAFYILGDSSRLSTDGYGTPNEWYWLHGLNPRLAGIATQDPDHDGLANFQEYRHGSDPQVSEGFGIWVATPQGAFGLP